MGFRVRSLKPTTLGPKALNSRGGGGGFGVFWFSRVRALRVESFWVLGFRVLGLRGLQCSGFWGLGFRGFSGVRV